MEGQAAIVGCAQDSQQAAGAGGLSGGEHREQRAAAARLNAPGAAAESSAQPWGANAGVAGAQ